MTRGAAIASLLLLTGCATGSGARWYAPTTWFSHRPADQVDSTSKKEEDARNATRKAAQRNAHSAALALAVAPASAPVAAAADFNASAVALLDQSEGPLQAGEIDKLKRTVAGLLSENAELKAQAQHEREREKESIASLSTKLAKAETASDTAGEKLRAAFERENAMANELRSQRALFWIACFVAALLGLGWLYVRFALGGMPVAIGRALGDLRRSHPQIADAVTPLLDQYLNRHEQNAVAKHAR